MIIHDIRLDTHDDGAREIIVGATNLQRWEWEFEDGATHAADAKTLVYVSLVDRGKSQLLTETMGLHIARVDPHRPAALAVIPELLEAAWEIFDGRWDLAEARRRIIGRRLGDAKD